MSDPNIPAPLASLKGSKLVEVSLEGHVWWFRFDPAFTLNIECVWRVTNGERIVVTGTDHSQMFGLPQPVDATEHVYQAVGANPVVEVALRSVSSDLVITFSNGATLEAISNSSGYENWHFFAADGREGRVLGGGLLQA